MQKMISEIIKEASEIPSRKDKIAFLQKYSSPALGVILQCVYHPEIKFLLPETDPPYKAAGTSFGHDMLYNQVKKIYLFVEGGNPNLTKVRREVLFIQFLESIHPDDAKMMLFVKNKKLHVKQITEALVREAFPNLLPKLPTKEENKDLNVQNT